MCILPKLYFLLLQTFVAIEVEKMDLSSCHIYSTKLQNVFAQFYSAFFNLEPLSSFFVSISNLNYIYYAAYLLKPTKRQI